MIPYKLKRILNCIRLNRALRNVDKIPKSVNSTGGDCTTELHMLVCKRDIRLAVLSTKSLLRFLPEPIRVVFSNDGSLSPSDINWLNSQFNNLIWLPPIDNKIQEELSSSYKQLAELYVSDFALARKLIHPVLMSSSSKVIVLDPDTAFFDRPDELIKWMQEDLDGDLYLKDLRDETRDVPGCVQNQFSEFGESIRKQNLPWNLKHYFFNSGLLAFHPERMNLKLAELFLSQRQTFLQSADHPLASIWFGDWTPEQSCYLAMYATMVPESTAFSEQYRIGNVPSALFNHFLWLNLVQSSTLKRLNNLVNELQK